MAGTFKFELVTPERMVVSQDASEVIIPGMEGAFTVLPGHAPVIATLRPGVVEATLGESRKVRAFVKGGFAEVDADHVTVLAGTALNVDSMDADAVGRELQTAEAELASAVSDTEKLAAASAVEQLRALQR